MPFHVELSHSSSGRKWDIQVSEACSFGQLKGAAAKLIGVPPEGFSLIFRGRPRSDDDFLVDAGAGPGSKIAAAETAEWRRARGADAALARAEEQAAARGRDEPSSHPISTPAASPPESRSSAAAAPAPPPSSSSSSSSDAVGRQLDALEAAVAALEGEAASAGLFTPPPAAAAAADQPRTTRGGLFSRQRRQGEAPLPPASDRAALYKEALRLSEFSTQQLLKLDAVELPHVSEEEGGEERGGGGSRGVAGGADGNGPAASSAGVALARERASALRLRRKALIKRAQALGDAMDRAKERLK